MKTLGIGITRPGSVWEKYASNIHTVNHDGYLICGLRDLIEAVDEGRQPLKTPEHGYHVREIMAKSMESGRTGQALPIISTFTPPRFDKAEARIAPHLDHAPT